MVNALLLKKGFREEDLPESERGRRYLVHKYGGKELELYYLSLRDAFHIQGYYDGMIEFEEMEGYLEYLDSYIKKVGEIREAS